MRELEEDLEEMLRWDLGRGRVGVVGGGVGWCLELYEAKAKWL